MFSLAIAYITKPLKDDWTSEIRTNGEKSVPDIRLPARDLIIRRRRKFEKERSNATSTGIFPIPMRKKGRILGKRSSKYVKNSVRAEIYAILFLLFRDGIEFSLIFNSASGLLTAFLSQVLRFPNETPKIIKESGIKEKTEENAKRRFSLRPKGTLANIITAVIIVVFAIGIFFVRSIPILLAFLALSLFVQFLGGRKIKIFPHIGLWIFVLASCLFSQSGKVIFKFWRFSITYGSLLLGIEKAIKLSAVSALSQYATVIKISNDGIFGLTHAYYKALSDCFRTTDGSLLKKLKKTLSSTILYEE